MFIIHFQQSIAKLKNAEDNLNSTETKKLLAEIEALKNKTAVNKAQAEEANVTANAASANATDAEKVSHSQGWSLYPDLQHDFTPVIRELPSDNTNNLCLHELLFLCFNHFQGLQEVIEQFKNLTERNKTRGANEEANERLNNLKMEAKNMAEDIKNKINQTEGMYMTKCFN